MFESRKPFAPGFEGVVREDGAIAEGSLQTMISNVAIAPAGPSLREPDWSELTARLNAARDLRRVLSDDQHGKATLAGTGFAHAAGRYLEGRESEDSGRAYCGGPDERQSPVNLDALERGKASTAKCSSHGGTGDGDADSEGGRKEATRETGK